MGRILSIAVFTGLMLLPPAVQAGDFGDMVSALAPENLTDGPEEQDRPFDKGTAELIELVGGQILAKGIVDGEERLVLLQVAGPFDESNPRKAFWGVVDHAIPVWDWEEKGPVLADLPGNKPIVVYPLNRPTAMKLAAVANPPSACTQPVLASYSENGYGINWCRKTASSPIRKKNYNYLYGGGDYALVMTLEHDCRVASDRAAMPRAVSNTC